jgi:uncharacterized linocin/CFP29 family protein
MTIAKVDTIFEGKAHGSVAAKLLASGMNVNALRTNDVLLYDDWKMIDQVVMKAYQERLVGVADLQARGLVFDVPGGLGKTVLGFQTASDIDDAEVSMDGVTRSKADRPEFDIGYLPLPITHADFSFSIREIEASRNGSMPLDTTMVELASRKVAERVEQTLFQGLNTYTFGGGVIYGYEDANGRNVGNLTANWDTSAGDGESILVDVLAMKQAAIDARRYGPYVLYAPTAYETALDSDFKANSDKTVRQRLLEINNIQSVKIADFLTADNVILAQMSSDTVRMVNGLDVTTVQWETDGGMRVNFKVMAIQVPQFRTDQAGRSGVVHYS